MKKVTKKSKPKIGATLGKRIEYVRTNLGMSQTQLAKEVNIKRELISYYETDSRPLYADTLKAISEALNVSTDYLLGVTDFESPNVDDIALNKQTGLTFDAIKVLRELNTKYNGMLLNTINFLIEQEGYLLMDNKQKYTPIIKPIDDYLSVSLKSDEQLYITDRIVKNEKDFNSNFEKEYTEILSKRIIKEQELIDNVLLQDVRNFIEYAKSHYLEKYKDRGQSNEYSYLC